MKKFLIFIYIIVILIFVKLVTTFCINEIVISKYNKENYDKTLAKSLFVLNFNEKYIAHYNYGNILYKIGYYEDAINEYSKALDSNPKKSRVCSIRTNLALALINTINDEMECEEKYKVFDEALETLYEDDCALSGTEVGVSEEADKLEEEIQLYYAEVKLICEQQESGGGEGDEEEEEGESEEEEEEKSEEEKKAEELEERNEEAQEKRQEELDKMEDYDDYGYGYYDGKKW